MAAVPVVFWNPRNTTRPAVIRRLLSHDARKENFGDLLGPQIVAGLGYEVDALPDNDTTVPSPRLLTVGSILRLARDGDVVWGTGVNGKTVNDEHPYQRLDVRAVRGPRTQAFLRGRGIDAPDVFGDPALLLPIVRPDLVELSRGEKRYPLSVIPNLNEIETYADHPAFVSPVDPLEDILRRIVQSERVVGTALHGTVVAEAFGVPAFSVRSAVEAPLKYQDYFEGTGRPGHPVFDTVDEAVAAPVLDGPAWTADALLGAFPRDIWPLPDGH